MAALISLAAVAGCASSAASDDPITIELRDITICVHAGGGQIRLASTTKVITEGCADLNELSIGFEESFDGPGASTTLSAIEQAPTFLALGPGIEALIIPATAALETDGIESVSTTDIDSHVGPVVLHVFDRKECRSECSVTVTLAGGETSRNVLPSDGPVIVSSYT